MIRCLLIKIGRNQRGLPIRAERNVDGDVLRIGRSAECNIHLPDHRVSLHHAHIRHSTDGKLYIDSAHAELNVDGTFVQSAELAVGMMIHLGPYQFVVEAMPQADQLTLSYELLTSQQLDVVADLKNWQPPSLHNLWFNQRRAAWLLVGLIVLGFMLLPMLQATSPQVGAWLQKLSVNPHQLWSSGALSNAHRGSNASCMDCHNQPFQAVANAACLKCHADTAVHGKHPSQKGTSRTNCIECHREHQGGRAMPNRSEGECVRCHADIKRFEPVSRLPNIRDFGHDHPEFQLSIRTGPNKGDLRLFLPSEAQPPRQDPGLKFSHATHIGKVSIPWDQMTVRELKCASCHQPDQVGLGTRPVNFRQHCFYCHQDKLEFDPVVAGRKLPHGSVAELSDTLRDYYAGLAFGSRQTPQWVSASLEHAAKTLTDEEDGCAYCHTIRANADPRKLFEVATVLQNQHWFPAARFPHNRHVTSKCVDCHKITESKDSAEIFIPDLATCRKCHAGMNPVANKVSSPCMSCHDYHFATAKEL